MVRTIAVVLTAALALTCALPASASTQAQLDALVAQMQARPVAVAPAAPTFTLAPLAPAKPAQSCTGLGTLNTLRYTAQAVNSFVVASAVRRGATQRVGGFGSGKSALANMALQGLIDYVLDRATRRASCGLQRAERWVFFIAPVINAANTEVSH